MLLYAMHGLLGSELTVFGRQINNYLVENLTTASMAAAAQLMAGTCGGLAEQHDVGVTSH